ncbi:pum [Symbiodinium necroappetens]|uniref:Pum protein n=1 Tax=Symbiodinium necroappetens TaxID=1628268 RepID=A0A813AIG5_9DINO|nr:pum [Symbiodinium necroappetens]
MTPVFLGNLPPTPEKAPQVQGRVWQLCQKQTGCRRVQEAIDACSSDQERNALAQEMAGHVWEAARCPFGNYVLQRFITLLRPRDCQFIIEEISSQGRRAASQLARHRYGCRIMQRLLEHLRHEQTMGMVDFLLKEGLQLVRHQYGNFVMQRILSHGTPAQRHSLCQLLLIQASDLATDQNASAVLAKALAHVCPEDKRSLANGLLSQPGLLLAMSKIRHGHQTALALLHVLEGEMLAKALDTMQENLSALSRSRYGRVVLRSIPALSAVCTDLPGEEVIAYGREVLIAVDMSGREHVLRRRPVAGEATLMTGGDGREGTLGSVLAPASELLRHECWHWYFGEGNSARERTGAWHSCRKASRRCSRPSKCSATPRWRGMAEHFEGISLQADCQAASGFADVRSHPCARLEPPAASSQCRQKRAAIFLNLELYR